MDCVLKYCIMDWITGHTNVSFQQHGNIRFPVAIKVRIMHHKSIRDIVGGPDQKGGVSTARRPRKFWRRKRRKFWQKVILAPKTCVLDIFYHFNQFSPYLTIFNHFYRFSENVFRFFRLFKNFWKFFGNFWEKSEKIESSVENFTYFSFLAQTFLVIKSISKIHFNSYALLTYVWNTN